ncbi:conserved hypothetical protein [Brucella ceti M644/93/1]|uniref:Secretion activator protein n=1 Tax=Brucella ceti M644/93/1 TaxID=520459 RepID=A0ABM9ZEL7_9HYPH|nr:Putative secretion activating protein [Brucella ceti TE10759-12]EEX90445.1 conserved hypothetical protein [Brucella ceti M13/05/1]EEX97899.1 conserved hypothetical protein [Brucella ceti M644/93/1]ENR11586.1 hypothetical protein C068_00727 [Brucella sp. UK38/05]ENT10855.1 hypothetical protein C001_01157 [Brucella sp. F5/06]
MKRNFQTVMPYIFSEEGGYADNPADPGGATNMGITINTLSAWEGRQVSPQDVKELTQATATQIYQVEFWNKIDGNDLPSGVDYALFDFAVNSGPGRAAKTLQKILAMPEDGIIGAQTVAAAAARSPEGIINALCDARAAWLRGLSTAATFGNGWLARVERVRARALALAATPPAITQPADPAGNPSPKPGRPILPLHRRSNTRKHWARWAASPPAWRRLQRAMGQFNMHWQSLWLLAPAWAYGTLCGV